jgi:uncharacterized protein (DUF1778 family)
MPKPARRQQRIALRVSSDAKYKLERAAAYAEKTLTDFVLDVALQKAESVVRDHEVIALTAPEWQRLQKHLLHPPVPNKRLKRAFAEHKRVVRS